MKSRNIVIGVLLVAVLGAIVYFNKNASPAVPGGGDEPVVTSTNPDITLAVGQTGKFYDLSITLNAIVGDSRCPADVQCIWAGNVTVNITLSSNGETETRDMSSDGVPYGVPYKFGAYEISISNIEPAKTSPGKTSTGDYRITFHLTR